MIDIFMKMSEIDQYIEDHPELEKLLSAPMFNGAEGVTVEQKFLDPKAR